MSQPAVMIENLSKKYRIGATRHPYTTFRDKVADLLTFRRTAADDAEIWALNDVSFDIRSGEVFGVIGRNGAGKSTLLKILSRITEPTLGRVVLNGRLASLLEVGTGFHPELTGRENVFLNGAILGMTRAEVRQNFDAIVEFAEVERFLDTPVKRYSSGMYVRLAFAVAAHMTPEILLVDEVLAVGDADFQRKCLGKMQSIGRLGRTVVFVSHNMSVVSTLCDRVVWLDRGRIEQLGDTHATIGAYLSAGIAGELVWRPHYEGEPPFRYHEVRIECDRAEGDAFPADADFHLVLEFSVSGQLQPGHIAMMLLSEDGEVVLSSASTDNAPALNQPFAAGRQRLRCTVPGALLHPGRYFLTLSEPHPDRWIHHEGLLNFTITEQNSIAARDGRVARVVPVLPWKWEKL